MYVTVQKYSDELGFVFPLLLSGLQKLEIVQIPREVGLGVRGKGKRKGICTVVSVNGIQWVGPPDGMT